MTEPLEFTSLAPRHSLPLLFAGQAQKEFTINEALARVDALLHAAVKGERADPPAAPEPGESWIVGAGATGAWMAQDGAIASNLAEGWIFVGPLAGMRVFDMAAKQAVIYSEGAWQRVPAPAEPAGGSTVDVEARTALSALVEALRNAGIFAES